MGVGDEPRNILTVDGRTRRRAASARPDGCSPRPPSLYPIAPGYRVNVRSGPGTQYGSSGRCPSA